MLTVFSVPIAILLGVSSPVGAAELSDGEALFYSGKYAACARLAAAEIADGTWDENWHRLKAEAELAQGKYPQARETAARALDEFPLSLPLRLVARRAYLHNGQPALASAMLDDIERYVVSSPRRFRGAADRVALGRFLLIRAADPRQVLELIYDPLRKESPEYVEAYLATAELALEKYDNALAADTLQATPKAAHDDPRYHYLLARAYAEDEPRQAEAALIAALKLNPRHVDSLLMQVDGLVDGEQYSEADKVLDQIFAVNVHHSQAWAYKAVLAHLANDAAAEQKAREQALATWPTNAEVDHVIGRKLSEKYRFAEGSAYQRRALALDDAFRPAKLQLAQDLLRLGDEVEGWRLADEVAQADSYNVAAFNLVTLEEELAKFRTLERGGFIVRMEQREAKLYGERVLDLLERARTVLCEKYDVELSQPVIVEIFPQQKDFAVRTFGMPGVSGFLGVCFGRVITANSPASQGERPANWQAVLWHEFCHVVTLNKTHNKMPRWLSEGISVYEERQADPTWGQSMTPQYREIILSGKMTPVSRLSSAFLAPPSPMDLQFAYYESSLVVEYLVERYGPDALKKILVDLGDGMEINETLLRHTAPLGRLDAEFAEFARQRAESLAPNAAWEEPDLPATASASAVAGWVEKNPDNVSGLERLARLQLRERKFAEAVETGERLRKLFDEEAGAADAWRVIAAGQRGLADAAAEQAALEKVAAIDADAADAYTRLIELAAEKEDWPTVATYARRMLAVNPLVVAPHRYLAQAAEKLNQRGEAIGAYRSLLEFETVDSADAHFRLGKLLREEGDTAAARQHVLMALEEAPRFLEAHRLLLELAAAESTTDSASSQPDSNDNATTEAAKP